MAALTQVRILEWARTVLPDGEGDGDARQDLMRVLPSAVLGSWPVASTEVVLTLCSIEQPMVCLLYFFLPRLRDALLPPVLSAMTRSISRAYTFSTTRCVTWAFSLASRSLALSDMPRLMLKACFWRFGAYDAIRKGE